MAKKNEKQKKPIISGTDKNVRVEDRYTLPGFIIQLTEGEVEKQFSDYQLDRDKEIFELLDGTKTSKWKLLEANSKLRRFIAAKKRTHEKTFIDELYDQWRRLRGWNKRPHAKHHKPWIFARYTILYVYGRFPKEVLPTLEDLNDYVYPGYRAYRHFQLLTDEGYTMVTDFINNVIDICKKCTDMYEFGVKYAAKYGRPFQLSIFRDNDEIAKDV